MKKKTIFQEAVEEAKTIREAAIANAKAALEESFMPHVKEMLTTKLQEMEEEEINEEELPLDDEPIEETETSFEDETLFEDEEIDLDEILAELEQENSGEESEELSESEDIEEAKKKEKDEKSEKKSDKKSEKKDEDEDEEDDEIGDMTVEELKDFIASVVSELKGEDEIAPEDTPEEIPGDEMEDFSTEPSMGGGEETPSMAEDRIFELKKEKDLLKKKVKKVEEQLTESVKAIRVLRDQLNETNLLNAKLLYMNKIFKSSQSLTESQKISIIDTLDKASTVKEAKLIYETLNNSLSKKTTTKTNIKENLGFSSKPISSTKKIIETDPVVDRWKKLAGLK